MIRENHRDKVLSNAVKESSDFKIHLDAVPGKVQLLEMQFKNPFEKQEIFRLIIEDSDPQGSCMEMVSGKQLDYWVRLGKAKSPPEKDSIGERSILLQPHQETPILLKYLSLRDNHKDISKSLTGYQKEITVRIVNASLITMCTLRVKVVPREIVSFDHIFRYDVPSGTRMTLNIPSFIPIQKLDNFHSIACSTDSVGEPKLINDGSNDLTFTTPAEGSKDASFYIYLF
jgi:hypothetical protein